MSPNFPQFLLCCALFTGLLQPTKVIAGDLSTAPVQPEKYLSEVSASAERALDHAELVSYRGWIKYLLFEARFAATKDGAASAAALTNMHRLGDWLDRIAANPALLTSLSGVQEWAYESPVDGSGQPFKFAIPTDYDPSRPAPLTVYMHGSGGNHMEHATAMAAHPGGFEISVLGRGRDGGYRALSEADVLQAIDYVCAHWAIDPDRVALRGGSMGGGGTYWLGSRYPQHWASGRPSCGFASNLPMGNLITLPIYATHSADDWVVSILHERGPLARLREMGGQVIFDETNGYGHAVWDYKEGNERGVAWVSDKVRPNSRSVRHIDYTALDGTATRGWWAEISEWGDRPERARFILTAGEANTLYAQLANISRLRLRLTEAPFDRTLPLRVSVDGGRPIVLPAPLPVSVTLAHSGNDWALETTEPPSLIRRHTPGSASLLYDGEPLLIVYGTGGDAAEQAAMRAAARVASQSSNPSWPDDSGEAGPEGVPNNHNLYGQLNTKADKDVTAEDLTRCNIVLIGTVRQNSLAARIAGSLPVSIGEHEIACSDGIKFSGDGFALGLVYYDPLAPQKLIYWVASNDPKAYAAGSLIPKIMAGGQTFGSNSFGADLLVMPGGAFTIVSARSFDSHWRWLSDREASLALDHAFDTALAFSAHVGIALQRAAAADAAFVCKYGSDSSSPIVAGVTRVSDVVPFFTNVSVGLLELSGKELAAVERTISATPECGLLLRGIDQSAIRPEKTYRIAIPVDTLWKFSAVLKIAPSAYTLTTIDAGSALEQFLGR